MFGWFSKKSDAQVDNDDNLNLLEQYEKILDNNEATNRALNWTIGELQLAKDAETKKAIDTIASILFLTGGQATVSKDIIDMVVSSHLGIDYNVNEDKSITISVVEVEQEEGEIQNNE